MFRTASKVWGAYLNVLNKYPMRVQIVQTGTLMSAGDVISQCWLEKTPLKNIDWARTSRFAILGCCLVGPAVRAWYLSLERLVGSGVTVRKTLSKVALDQLGFAPVFTVAILGSIGLLQGQSLSNIKVKLENEYVDIMLTGWKIWPATQLVNFYFVPFLVRPLVVAFVALFWNTYLAWKCNRSPDLQHKP